MARTRRLKFLKFDWPTVYRIFKEEVAKKVTFENDKNNDALIGFRHLMRDTDTFWPSGSDGGLARALSVSIQKNIDYRKCDDIQEKRKAIYSIEDAIDEMLYEVEEYIPDYFDNPWNFGPGEAPIGVNPKMDFDDLPEIIWKRIRREAASKTDFTIVEI